MKNKSETPEEKQYREAVEKIATNISKLARAVESLLTGPLKRKAIVTLLASSSGHSKATVEQVLGALESLEKDWLNQ